MLTVGIYISINGVAKRIELFDDEKISVTSSIQNIADISKIYTDFSQSFTVPATKNNNSIFSHWYDNSLVNSFDARRRKNAYIELDTIPFRNGTIQLESVALKDGKPDNYTITFFGNLVSLKDIFNGLLLKDIDFSEFDFAYSGPVVQAKVEAQTTDDVKFPLITSLRHWDYGGHPNTDDITIPSKAIDYKELFPALRLSKVFKGIEDFYDITFQGDFLTSQNFTNAYLWLKNGDGFKPQGSSTIVFDELVSTTTYSFFDIATNIFEFVAPPPSEAGVLEYEITSFIDLTFSVNDVPFTLTVVKDGIDLFSSNLITSTTTQSIDLTFIDDGNYYFKISTETVANYDAFFDFSLVETEYSPFDPPVVTELDKIQASQSISGTTSATASIQLLMPDIKVEDFFSGILRMFNLTCFSIDGNTYNIRQIENYYNSGDIVDITPYIFKESMTLDRVKSYKRVNFEYQKSENLISVAFLSANGVEYGNLAQDFDADGEEYSVSLPFENLLFSNLNDRLQVGYSLKTDLKPYIPKPIILYDYGVAQTGGFYLNDGTNNNLITNYNAFGSETLIGGITYSLNFGIEQSSLTNDIINDSLYFNYYQNYLGNIFTSKARQIKVKGILPLSLLTSLSLNDRVIIQDKRYIINSYTTDLTTGEVDFDLLSDFRTL